MRDKTTLRIVLVDDESRGPTARILESAVYNSSGRQLAQQGFETLTLEQAQRTALDPSETAVFVSVSEEALSFRGNGTRANRVACKSLEVAQALVQTDSRLRVVLVRPASAFTAIDVVAALLAGMAGLIDDRHLIVDGVLDAVLGGRHFD